MVVGKEADVVATGLGNAGNQFANLTDVAGTSAKATDTSINETSVGAADGTVASIAADDTGEFRIKLDNVVEAGRMTVQILKGTDSDVNIDGFILIGGVDTGSNESLLDLRLDQSGNHFDIRNGSSELGTFNTGTIYNVEISWDASTATTALAPTIAISIDGIPLFSGDSTTNNLTEAENGVQFIQFRVADGDDISRADFKIDELVVYETQADGTELIVLEDDFEIYTAGDSLDSDANTKAGFELQQTPSPLIPSQYDSNSFSVIVDAE